jgi:hypothetical protein
MCIPSNEQLSRQQIIKWMNKLYPIFCRPCVVGK